jgi:hypothetical protein
MRGQGRKRPIECGHGRAGSADDDNVVFHLQLLFCIRRG